MPVTAAETSLDDDLDFDRAKHLAPLMIFPRYFLAPGNSDW